MSFFSKFASLFTAIVRPDRSAYTTVIYPNRGKAVVVHDGLGIRHEHACDQSLGSILREGVEVTFSFDDYAAWSEPGAQAQADNFLSGSSTGCVAFMEGSLINPVNGMPMMDSCFDVLGNPYGMDALGDRLYFDHEATNVGDTSSPFDPD
ncbi:hypothetical protein [Stutzerimonas kunmingensis]|uniref:hypothetical protein n=1 Tax=Stutzerimonas kunmingensis TaxID=1211807 RepID=UPI00289DA089|nr:hypothetical protein [Stutzerimonas kunmingensis]